MKPIIKLSCYLILFANTSSYAEISTDGTTGTLAAHTLTPTVIDGKSFEIPQSLGTTAGNNLFHSFQSFNINTGESATFTGSSSLQNVISRVTGGQVSNINGLLKSEVGNANFYFINPAGVTFGANATIDVPAAFHVSTANSFKFTDGSQFNAVNANASVLSIAEPASFGFLGNSVASIQIRGSQLTSKSAQSVDFVAGNITIENNAKISAPTGEIRIVATQGQANVSLIRDSDKVLPLPTLAPSLTNAGNISIQQSALEAAGNGSERIALWGGDTVVNDSQIHIFNDAVTDAISAKTLDIHVNSLNLDHADIATEAHSSGKGADINIQTTDSINILNNSFIEARVMKEGNAGDINVNVGGNLKIYGTAERPFEGIRSRTQPDSSGNAANITVHALGDITIANGAVISSRTNGAGKSGDTAVTSNGTITLDSSSDIESVRNSYSSGANIEAISLGTGRAGSTTVAAKDIALIDGGAIRSWGLGMPLPDDPTSGATTGTGDVRITATNTIIINGEHNPDFNTGIANLGNGFKENNIDHNTLIVKAKEINMIGNAWITGETTRGIANGCDVSIIADILKIDGKSTHSDGVVAKAGITSESLPWSGGNGNAGTVTVEVGALELKNFSAISSSTYTSGNAGTTTVNAKTVSIESGSFISSASKAIPSLGIDAKGRPGDVIVTASDWIHLSNNAKISIQNEAKLSDADAANIIPGFLTVTAPEIELQNSSITTASTGNVAAGNININFSKALKLDPSFISTTANTGNGGTITINGTGLIYLENSGFLTSVTGTNSNGGNIDVTANSLIMNNAVIQANAVGGSGGNINLNLQSLIPSYNQLIKGGAQVIWQPFIEGFNVIQAASANGVSGLINLTSPQFNISGSISGLNSVALQAVKVLKTSDILEEQKTEKLEKIVQTNVFSTLFTHILGFLPRFLCVGHNNPAIAPHQAKSAHD